MGASGWSYFTPYQEDIEQALQALRKKVFEDGHYQKLWLFYEVPDEVFDELDNIDDSLSDRRMLEALAQILKEKQMPVELPPPPQSIEEVLLRNGPEETHSILDIEHVALEPKEGVAVPLSREKFLELFGTDRPTRAMIEATALEKDLESLMPRWQALYIIAYKDDAPHEIFFIGHSGD